MNTQLLVSKVEMLSKNLQQEVEDFIDYLISKQKKLKTNYPTLSENETNKNIELSTVNDAEADYLNKKEVDYYLKLKDEH